MHLVFLAASILLLLAFISKILLLLFLVMMFYCFWYCFSFCYSGFYGRSTFSFILHLYIYIYIYISSLLFLIYYSLLQVLLLIILAAPSFLFLTQTSLLCFAWAVIGHHTKKKFAVIMFRSSRHYFDTELCLLVCHFEIILVQ